MPAFSVLPRIYLCEMFFHILGKDQVTDGVVPLDAKHRSSQSAKSVYPLAIANCKEKRFVSNYYFVYILYILFGYATIL